MMDADTIRELRNALAREPEMQRTLDALVAERDRLYLDAQGRSDRVAHYNAGADRMAAILARLPVPRTVEAQSAEIDRLKAIEQAARRASDLHCDVLRWELSHKRGRVSAEGLKRRIEQRDDAMAALDALLAQADGGERVTRDE